MSSPFGGEVDVRGLLPGKAAAAEELAAMRKVGRAARDLTRDDGADVRWYNEHRPSQALSGRTPNEVYFDRAPANERPRYEPRRKWPRKSPCAAPRAKVKGRRGMRLELALSFLEGRKHLPVVEIRPAA